MTDDIKARLRELLAKATPGPWFTLDPPWLPGGSETSILAESPDPHVARFICDFDLWALDDDEDRKSECPDDDARLIVECVNALPDLLDHIETLEARIAELEGEKYEAFTDGLEAAAEICGSMAETTYDDADAFEAATGCESAIMQVIKDQRREQAQARAHSIRRLAAMDKLEPCPNPWCNSHKSTDAEIIAAEAPILVPSKASDEWAIACPVCPIQTPWLETEAEAIAAWNERTHNQRLLQALKEAREALAAVKQHDDSAFLGPDREKHARASWRGVRRKATKALAKIDKIGGAG